MPGSASAASLVAIVEGSHGMACVPWACRGEVVVVTVEVTARLLYCRLPVG
jgi:hypothetical protein